MWKKIILWILENLGEEMLEMLMGLLGKTKPEDVPKLAKDVSDAVEQNDIEGVKRICLGVGCATDTVA